MPRAGLGALTLLTAAACGGSPSVSLPSMTVVDVELDTRTELAEVVPNQYWVTLEVELDNHTDDALALDFAWFEIVSDSGLSYLGSPATEYEPSACTAGTKVLAGRQATCRVLFSMREGDLPTALVYTGASAEVEAPVELCPPDEDLCGYQCVDLRSDPLHCGACDHVIEGGDCIDGSLACAAPTSACGDRCVDLSTDLDHCGQCDAPVPDGRDCRGGVVTCPGEESECDGQCVDLSRDSSHCGQCDRIVPEGAFCSAGMPTCSGAMEYCSDACVDITSDPDNCGGCGNVCPVPAGLDPERGCNADFTPTCTITFPTPGGRCVNVCGSFGWDCDIDVGSCNCMTDHSPGACECGCTIQ